VAASARVVPAQRRDQRHQQLGGPGPVVVATSQPGRRSQLSQLPAAADVPDHPQPGRGPVREEQRQIEQYGEGQQPAGTAFDPEIGRHRDDHHDGQPEDSGQAPGRRRQQADRHQGRSHGGRDRRDHHDAADGRGHHPVIAPAVRYVPGPRWLLVRHRQPPAARM